MSREGATNVNREQKLTKDQVDRYVVLAQKGESSAFEALYDHFYDQIFRYITFKTSDYLIAEDLTEDVFLRMLESIRKFKPQGHPFSAWLFRIAHNRVIDHYRKRGRDRNVPLDTILTTVGESESTLDNYVETKLAMREVNQAMENLTDLQREVLNLRFAGGLSIKETAEAVNRNENSVKALQHSAVKKLRGLLQPNQLFSEQLA
ncbi:MAG: RNA polymerase subunit sigma-70 [Dehalococcoidia bacterium]|nr:RNA polymerase subunit sigma-70 [Dehalococcoidia bacterium]MAX04421.1 RNA polymerase subunit sigma-70 [Dehalococcoidia bacterium]